MISGVSDPQCFEVAPVVTQTPAAPTSQIKDGKSDDNHWADSSPRVVEVQSIEELDQWKNSWDLLLAKTEDADFFYTLDWLKAYWKHYGEHQQLRVMFVLQGDEAIGILPLVIAPLSTSLGHFSVLTYPLDWWGSFYGPIGADPEKILKVSLEHLRQNPQDWDFMELRFVRGDAQLAGDESPTIDPVLQVFNDAQLSVCREPHLKCARITIQGTWEEYLETRRKSWRSNVRRTEKKTLKAGRVEHVRHCPAGAAQGDDDPRWDLYEECLNLAKQSWQGSSRDGHTLSHDHVLTFFKDAHQAATSAGNLDMNLLKIDGKPVAFNYGYHFNGYFSGLRLGFDPAYAKLGVGTVLTGWMIRDSFERGDRVFDFLPDCLKAKLSWQTSVDVGYRYTHYPSLLGRSQLLRMKRWFDRTVRSRSLIPE